MRYRAMQAAGWTEAPVKVVDWPEDKQKQFIIKDNVSGGEWDWEMLAKEWDAGELDEWGLEIPDGFEFEERVIEEDTAPELDEETISSANGYAYQLGRHRIYCGDATDKQTVAKLMQGAEADLIFTDPPYGISYTGVAGSDKWAEGIDNDDLRAEGLQDFLAQAYQHAYDNSTPEAAMYTWFSSKNHRAFQDALEQVGYQIKQELIWNKGMTLSGADYQYAHEPLLYAQKQGQKAQWHGGRDKKSMLRPRRVDMEKLSKDTLLKLFMSMQKEQTVWEIDRDNVQTYQHPTQKPVGLAAQAIQNSTAPRAIVLDMFLGSGSTLMAAEQTDRTCLGLELDPKYVDVIRKRYAKWTNGGKLPDDWQERTNVL